MTAGRLFQMALLIGVLLLAGCASRPTGPGLELVEGANPVYPEAARERRIEGSVTLVYNVAEDGRVTDLEVYAAEPEGVFEEAALDAVRTWRYRAPRDGQVVENVGSTLEFRLGEAYPEAEPPADPAAEVPPGPEPGQPQVAP